ncbi:MAG: hypothetical protein ABH808_00845 [Candidatus Kuenenbacteria bacterium]
MKMNLENTIEFKKDFKKLFKKFKSLDKDLIDFKKVLNEASLGIGKHFNIITKNEQCIIVKARLFCRCLKGSSLRIIYAFHSNDLKINFIEIYFKGEKKNENFNRIKDYLKKLLKQK